MYALVSSAMPTLISFIANARKATLLLVPALCLTVLCHAVLLQNNIATAHDDPFQELKERIEHVENEDGELHVTLVSQLEDVPVPLLSQLPSAPSADDAQSNMNSLFEGYLRRLSEQNQAVIDAQNQKIAALEMKLEDALKKPKPTSATGDFGNSGLLFTSADGNFKTHFGGTAQLDFIAPQTQFAGIGGLTAPPGQTNMTQDSTNFRRLRMRADGTMYGYIDWVSEFDFAGFVQNTAGATANLADNGLRSFGTLNGGQQGGNTMNVIQPTLVWMTFKEVPIVQNVRVGNQQDWLSIEHITSARYLDFMERAPIMDVFTGPNNNGYTPGVSIFGNSCDQVFGYQLGVYKNNAYDSGYTFSVGNAFTYGGRGVWVPYYDEESNGRYLVHTAFGTEYRTFNTTLPTNQNGENIRLRSRGDLRMVSATLTPNFTDSGNFFVEGQTVINPEIAVVWGPWTFQAEYAACWFNGARTTQLPGGFALGDCFMSGGYAEAMYFLTGENKSYNRQTGLFNQTIPLNNVNLAECKYGAWQVGMRYDWMDMNAGLITGGRNQNATLGLNWFLNPNVRFQVNLVGSYIDNAASPVIAGPVGSAASGTLQAAKFTGHGLLTTIGTRMDISF